MNSFYNSLAVVQTAVARATGVQAATVTTDTAIPANVAPDSPQFTDFHMFLENAISVTIPVEIAESWVTVSDAVAYLDSLIGSSGYVAPRGQASF
jgi:acyl carrier protein